MNDAAIPTPKDREVTFRYIAVQHHVNDVGGFALWYQCEDDARADFRHFHNYLTAAGNVRRSFCVSFDKDSGSTHSLRINLSYDSVDIRIEIGHIESEYVERLRRSIAIFPYFFITAGYTDSGEKSVVLPTADYMFFSAVLFIEGERLSGSNHQQWPKELFECESVHLLEEGGAE